MKQTLKGIVIFAIQFLYIFSGLWLLEIFCEMGKSPEEKREEDEVLHKKVIDRLRRER